jgi:alcohol dehydrogenase YqhD (iron-dependent ADH family)
MRDFNYYAPTKVYFGKDKQKEVGKIIAGLGYKTIMMQYGKSSIKESGLYDQVMKALNDENIKVIEMGGVEPNPKVSFVRRAAEIAIEKNVEFILAVGGGSVLDSCKATAISAANNTDVWDIITGKKTPQSSIPVGCILTISAAGSEMSGAFVLTNSETNEKRGFTHELNRCKFAICNPALTCSVSKYQTSCGTVDIMAHTMERYFTPYKETDLTDRICESLLKSVVVSAKTLMNEPDDYEARANIMWASSISHNDLTGCGRENALCVHQIEHGLSGEFDHIAHGAGLAVLFPAWARFIYKQKAVRIHKSKSHSRL